MTGKLMTQVNQSFASAFATLHQVIKMANSWVLLYNAEWLKHELENKIFKILL